MSDQMLFLTIGKLHGGGDYDLAVNINNKIYVLKSYDSISALMVKLNMAEREEKLGNYHSSANSVSATATPIVEHALSDDDEIPF